MSHTVVYSLQQNTAARMGTVLDERERLYGHLEDVHYLPSAIHELGQVWCKGGGSCCDMRRIRCDR